MTCIYSFKKGAKKGQSCGVRPRNGGEFCSRHKKYGTQVVSEPEQLIEGDCTICMESGNDLIKACSNGHTFHKDCILPWGRRKHRCPCCRVRMFPSLINNRQVVINERVELEALNRRAINELINR